MSNVRDLNGSEHLLLRDALTSAFPTPDELAQMVQFGLDENLYGIAKGDLNNLAFELIRWARARNKTLLLIQAARDQNAGNERLRRFAENFGMTPKATDLEKIVAERDPERFSDPDG